jgi:hypothetical protein
MKITGINTGETGSGGFRFQQRLLVITRKDGGVNHHIMPGFIVVILVALAVAAGPPLGGTSRAAGDKEYLALRHMARGHTCETCHKENPPKAKTSYVACMECHGDAKKMAERTKNSNPNPHAYAPDMVCTKCHYGHK